MSWVFCGFSACYLFCFLGWCHFKMIELWFCQSFLPLDFCRLAFSSYHHLLLSLKEVLTTFLCQSLLSRFMRSVKAVAKIWKCGQALPSSVSSFNPVSVQSLIHRWTLFSIIWKQRTNNEIKRELSYATQLHFDIYFSGNC